MAKTHEITFEEDIPNLEGYQPKVVTWTDFGPEVKRYGTPESYRRLSADVKKHIGGLRYYPEPKPYDEFSVINFDASEKRWESLSGSQEDVMRPFEDAINTSYKIVEIEDNWDSEGSPGYSEETWLRATSFVRNIAATFLNRYATTRIGPPTITPGPDGSIDVRWVSAKRTMLINFPANENAPADFFGHDKGQDIIKGTLDLASQNHWLLLWLTR